MGQFLIFRKTLQNLLKELFPNYLERIFQAKGQSKRVYHYFLTLSFLFLIINRISRKIKMSKKILKIKSLGGVNFN